jgi:hypothetical protein
MKEQNNAEAKFHVVINIDLLRSVKQAFASPAGISLQAK